MQEVQWKFPDPAPLPAVRVRDAPPFTVTGVDFTGAQEENHQEVKVYICLYTCATSRAIHLEIVNDLTVDMFLLSFSKSKVIAQCIDVRQCVDIPVCSRRATEAVQISNSLTQPKQTRSTVAIHP